MQKYIKTFDDMLRQNKQKFAEFKVIHDQFAVQPNRWRKEFNERGGEIQMIIRRYENMLCMRSENGGFSKFTGNLSEKFWEEIRKLYPKIDKIGIQ